MQTVQNGTIEEILSGPAHENDGTFNLMGALRTSMATCGYKDIAEFNRAELMIAPALQTEGKALQTAQGVGMGARGRPRRTQRRRGRIGAHRRATGLPRPAIIAGPPPGPLVSTEGLVTAATAATELVDEDPRDVARRPRSTRSSSSTTAGSTRS